MTKLKTGIIGLGRIASEYEEDDKARRYYPYLTHTGMYAKHPGFQVVCGADIDRQRLERFRSMWGVGRVYEDYRTMIAENALDVVSICTHSESHREIIRALLNKVNVIFCEKPFTNNSGEIRDIIKMQSSSNTRITINLYREYDRSHLTIRRMLQSGTFGKLVRFNAYYGKGLRNQGTHLLGYLVGTLGKPQCIRLLGKRMYAGMDEYAYDAYMEFGNGIPGIVQSCDFNNYRLFEFDFVCEEGRIQIIDEGLTIRLFKKAANKAETGAYALEKADERIRSTVGYAFKYAADHIEDLCRDSTMKPLVSPEAYLDIQLVIEEIEKQGEGLICSPH